MNDLHYIAIGLSTALLGFLVWKETSRPNKARIGLRIIANVLTVAGLLCLILPLQYRKDLRSDRRTAIVLTPGFSEDSVNAFIRTISAAAPVYVADNTLTEARKFRPQLLDSREQVGSILHVFGQGLPRETLQTLAADSIVFHPSLLTGITGVHWNTKLFSGEKLVMTGTYHNPSGRPLRIALSSYRSVMDSATIPAKTTASFRFSFVPKQIGRSICRLSVLNRSDTLQDEPVPFEVAETSPPAVLLLASSPGFEDRFLRNWLAEKNYPVITRTVVSKNKFTREYLNTRSVATDRISDALLNQVDIVVADAASMAALDANERSTLQSYLRQKRKGLILRTDNDSLRTGFHTALFALMPADSGAQQGTRLYLNDTATQLAPLHLSGTPALRAREGSKTLLTAGGRSYAASTLFGAGKIVATTLNNSFNWILAGERDSYNNVWSALFNEAMGRDKAEESWTVQPWLPAVHEPATIILQSGQQQIPQAQINGAAVYLSQNINFPFQWTGSYWPAQPGWQTGIALNGTPWYWYAFDSKDWQTARMAQTEQETQRILNKEQGTRNGGSTVTSNNFRTADSRLQTPDSKLQTVPKFWFFLLFFIPLAFLWFENKYYNR